MNRLDIDKVIEDSLTMRLNNYDPSDEVFARVIDNLSNTEKKVHSRSSKICFNRNKPLKLIVNFMCGLIIFCSLSVIIFPEARVFATNTINTIKTIFVINDNGEIIEKGQDVPLLNDGFGMPTDLNDSDLEQKVGFKVIFPSTLPDGFSLLGKNIGLFLGKDISYETNERISSICKKAILNDSELEKLKEYNPSRYAGGKYSSSDGEIILCAFKSTDKYYKSIEYLKKSKCNYKEIKIGDIEGIWLEQKRPVYPNGDMTQKPIEVINTYDMFWVSKDLLYYMSTSDNKDINRICLSPEMGIRIAESFMLSQK